VRTADDARSLRRAASALELPRLPLATFLAAVGGGGAAGDGGGAAGRRVLADIHVSLLRRVLEGLRATDRNVRVRARPRAPARAEKAPPVCTDAKQSETN
jgi:hypothetical protein